MGKGENNVEINKNHLEKEISTLFYLSLSLLIYLMFLQLAEAFYWGVRENLPDVTYWYLTILAAYVTQKRSVRWNDKEKSQHCGHRIVYVFWFFAGAMYGFYIFLGPDKFRLPNQLDILTESITAIYLGGEIFKIINVKKNGKKDITT